MMRVPENKAFLGKGSCKAMTTVKFPRTTLQILRARPDLREHRAQDADRRPENGSRECDSSGSAGERSQH